MKNYTENQKKEDLETLDLKGDNLSIKLLIGRFKKLAKIRHPDKGGSKEAFQRLKNAYDRLLEYIESEKNIEDEELDHEKIFFKTANFPHEKKNCFVVILENFFF